MGRFTESISADNRMSHLRSVLCLGLDEDVDGGVVVSCGRANGGHDALAARSVEGVNTCPVSRPVGRLEDVDTDIPGRRNQDPVCRVSKAGTPPASTSV